MSTDEFHRQNRARGRAWPHAMLSSSTHDTKRSEDVRARISVLSEAPTDWRAALNRWSRLNRKLKRKIEGALAPHRVDEYVMYQTMIGTWPLGGLESIDRAVYSLRLREYIVKVAREANRLTNWVNPNDDYEAALTGFVAGLLDGRRSRAFLADFQAFVNDIVEPGLINGLAQQVLKLTAPGVPDIYQGTEYWDDSPVDPDNRRPVDFADRRRAIETMPEAIAGDPGFGLRDPRTKLAVTARLLATRREHPPLFAEGDYTAIQAEGPAAAHVVAFLRRTADASVLVVVPRLSHKLAKASGLDVDDPALWADTTVTLPANTAPGAWRNAITGAAIEPRGDETDDARTFGVDRLFQYLPISVLIHTLDSGATS